MRCEGYDAAGDRLWPEGQYYVTTPADGGNPATFTAFLPGASTPSARFEFIATTRWRPWSWRDRARTVVADALLVAVRAVRP